MPGLKELEQFRNELSLLGNERKIVAERGETYEELPLPTDTSLSAPQIDVDDLLSSLGTSDTDAIPHPDTEGEAQASDVDIPSDMFDLPEIDTATDDETVPENPAPQEQNIQSDSNLEDFDKLLDSLPLNENSDQTAQAKDDALPQESEIDEPVAVPDDFSIPEDLLSGFSDEVAENVDTSDTSDISDEFSLPDFNLTPDENISELSSNLDLTPEGMEEGPPVKQETVAKQDTDVNNIPDLEPEIAEELSEETEPSSVPETTKDPIAGLDDLLATGLPALDETDSSLDFEMPSVDEKNEEVPDIADIPDVSFPAAEEVPPNAAEEVVADENTKEPTSEIPSGNSVEDDFSIPDDLGIPEAESETAENQSEELDGFDGFSLDEDFLKTGIENELPESEDFHIPGFSDFTSTPSHEGLSDFSSSVIGSRKGAKKEIPLQISEDDLEKFLTILTGFPLNLRMAVEEYLSGDDGTDIQKMEVVHDILIRTPVRKIARNLEHLLDRSISIPKDYEKKTAADYEKEKSSLKYVVLNKILPIATIFTIIAVLTACVVYLSYQFIYRPIAAENLYRRGYAAIEDTRYTQSLNLFDQAVEQWDKKNWYFKYAQAYRDKKQYLMAGSMYERILNHFKNDRHAGLEYAEMLRSDLRNYEKAETILRRRLLDNYVNDPDGLLLLGDVYLDWADESPEKYEMARKTYASLIELYGTKDPYLARMMRYFIRTDNLAEVLPLKDHFMNKRAKIGSTDLVELSGYLLDKRYEPQSGDSEYLREQIEDVRTLLERAVKADDTSPEAHYNMGKFFIYNYKNELAVTALSESLRLFDNAKTMSPKRVLTRIDAYRLLGELLAGNNEYLGAQKEYAMGLDLYEKERANRTIRSDPRVGKLYADQADIDYFISNDLDRALLNYNKAMDELQDTPSIRYRIGYIHYQKQNYEASIQSFARAYADVPTDKNLLYSFGNSLFRRGDYYAAQGYYEHLMEELEAERIRKGILFPQIRSDHAGFVERYMQSANNLGVILNRQADRTGDSQKNARAMALFSESARAWDALTRNPETMVRAQGSNLAYLNIQNMTRPRSDFKTELYPDIPKTLENEKILQQRVDQ